MEEHRRITEAVLLAQEKERNAIGLELHDNVNQLLVGSNMLLSLIRNRLRKYLQVLTSCIDNIQKAVDETRKIAHGLVTPSLESETLLQQIEHLCHSMLRPAGVRIWLDQVDYCEELINDQSKLAIYRIAQE